MSNKLKVLLGIIVAFVWWYVSNPIAISVTGVGMVKVPATYLVSQITIVTSGKDAANALLTLNNKILTARTVLKRSGVAEENISQAHSQVTPAAMAAAGATGYQASVTMVFKSKDISGMDNLVSNLYANGATLISQPVFQTENPEGAEQEAMKQAMSKADLEAKSFAASKWRLVRKIVAVQQASSGTSAQSTIKDGGNSDLEVASNGSVQIARAVQVTYRMW